MQIFFKSNCLHCDQKNDLAFPICSQCLPPPIFSPSGRCLICFDALPDLPSKTHCFNCLIPQNKSPLKIYYAWNYENSAAQLICKMKAKASYQITEVLGTTLIDCIESYNLKNKFNAVIAPPLSSKSKGRLFNQSAILAAVIAKTYNAKFHPALLHNKTFFTRSQKELKREERLTSRNYIIKRPDKIKNAKVLLVDDVITTGSTMNTAAKCLLAAGADSVICLALAKTQKNQA